MQRLAPFPLTDPGQAARSRFPALRALPGWLVPATLAAAIVAGVALRIGWAFQTGLHPDEALYASWALRIADGSDPALLRVFVDKPPFLPYLLAGLARLLHSAGGSVAELQRLALAGRLAGAVAGLFSLFLLWGIVQPVYGRRTGALAVAIFALSPLATRLSPGLLTDPWLILWMLLGLWAAVRGRPWLAGMAAGLAWASKQQALFILPLIVATLLLFAPAGNHRLRTLWRWFCGFALLAVLVLWWDSLRWQWMPSYWERSATTYGGLALISNAQLPGHLAGWAGTTATTLCLPLLVLLVALWGGRAVLAVRGRSGPRTGGRPAGHAAQFDALLGLFVLGYLLVHLATTIAPWDRYALPLVPVLAILLARAILWWIYRLQEAGHVLATTALIALIAAGGLWSAAQAVDPRYPVADNAAYAGAPALAGYILDAEPVDAVVYHHSLGWHLGYYLYGSGREVLWWQSPDDLARLAAGQRGRPLLVALLNSEDRTAPDFALRRIGLGLVPVFVASHPDGSPSATLYRIVATGGATAGG